MRTIRDSQRLHVSGLLDEPDGEPMLLAAGQLREFAVCYGSLRHLPDGSALVTREAAETLGVRPGDGVLAMGR